MQAAGEIIGRRRSRRWRRRSRPWCRTRGTSPTRARSRRWRRCTRMSYIGTTTIRRAEHRDDGRSAPDRRDHRADAPDHLPRRAQPGPARRDAHATTASSSWARKSASTTARTRSRKGLLEEFGEMRVVDTPITELGFAGVGVGAAMVGLRPIVEFMTWNFALLALDQVVNAAAKMLYMSRRPVQHADRLPRPERRGAAALGAALAGVGVVARAHPGPQGRHARHAVRREGAAQERDPRRQSR